MEYTNFAERRAQSSIIFRDVIPDIVDEKVVLVDVDLNTGSTTVEFEERLSAMLQNGQ